MARKALIKVRRGLETELIAGTLADGEFGFTTDAKKLYVGLGGQNVLLVNTSTSGDMQKNIYDTNNNGIIDNADMVDGKHASDILLKNTGITWNDLRGV